MKRKDKGLIYISRLAQLIHLKRPDLDINEVKKMSKKLFSERVKPVDVTIEGQGKVPINKLDEVLIKNDYIVTGSGAVYLKPGQETSENVLRELISDFKKKRKIYKDNMFEHINDEDPSIHDMYDLYQQTIKILNNSLYGVLTQSSSIFFNSYSGEAVTYTGEDIITASVSAFENFLTNNIFFKDMNDIYNYILNIRYEKYEDYEIEWKQVVSSEKLAKYLVDHIKIGNYLPNEEEMKRLERTLSNLDDNTKMHIYFKNNIYEFFDHTNFLDKYMSHLIGRTDFIDPNEAPEDMIDDLKLTWKVLSQYVLYNYQDFHRFYKAEKGTRKSVLAIDTDSNFVLLDNFYKYLINKYPDKIDDSNRESRISTISVINYNLTNLLEDVYYKMTLEMGVQEDFAPIIAMKNELLIDRIMLTTSKKHYASSIAAKEGNIYDNPVIDLKGLSIKKVSTNKNVREYYTEILEKDILEADKISLTKIINKYKNLEVEIKESLLSGSIEYTLPAKAKKSSSYVDPYSIQGFRATLAWNEFFPEMEIELPNKIDLIKLNIPDMEAVKAKIDDEELLEVFETLFNNKNLTKNGLNVMAINDKKIPDFIIPFIDIEAMINTHTKSGMPIMESLGFEIMDSRNNEFTSNIIKL